VEIVEINHIKLWKIRENNTIVKTMKIRVGHNGVQYRLGILIFDQ